MSPFLSKSPNAKFNATSAGGMQLTAIDVCSPIARLLLNLYYYYYVFCLHEIISVPLPGTGAPALLPSSLHYSLFSVIFLTIDATSIDPLTCSFLILSFFVTPHVHLGTVISFAPRLRPWYSVVAQVCSCSMHREHIFFTSATLQITNFVGCG